MLSIQSVFNVLTALTAINYNKERYYSKTAILIIQKRIGAPQTGVWDIQSCTAVYDWQRSVMRLRPMTADGMFGPTSLGILIEELVIQGHKQEAEFLRQFKHKDKFGNIVIKEVKTTSETPAFIVQNPVSPLALRRPDDDSKWAMKGCFKVDVFIDPSLPEPSRYEYRQFIRGRVYIHDGYFHDAKNQTGWQPREGAKEETVNNCMAIPGGLNQWNFTEDGEVMSGNRIERFGYRSKPPTTTREGILDVYSNNQMGAEYQLMDTFGIEGPRKQDSEGFYKSGLKVGVHLQFRGIVIKDGRMPTFAEMDSSLWKHVSVAHKEWEYRDEKFVWW